MPRLKEAERDVMRSEILKSLREKYPYKKLTTEEKEQIFQSLNITDPKLYQKIKKLRQLYDIVKTTEGEIVEISRNLKKGYAKTPFVVEGLLTYNDEPLEYGFEKMVNSVLEAKSYELGLRKKIVWKEIETSVNNRLTLMSIPSTVDLRDKVREMVDEISNVIDKNT